METRRKIITNLWNDALVMKALREEAEEIISPAQHVLDNSMDMNEVLKARGIKDGLKKLFLNIEAIALEENEDE